MINQQICSRCIYDTRVPGIQFNTSGVCNYCLQIDELEAQYKPRHPDGEVRLKSLLSNIRRDSKNNRYGCVVGVSGGTDSSYLLLKAVEWGLRPLAVHYDNTWNTSVATENIRKITSVLGVDLYTHVINNKESEDIFRSFLYAGVPEFDASTDIALVQTLRTAAAKHKVKYILEGHSFLAEGISPIGNYYFDGRYIQDIHRKFGRAPIKTFPNMMFFDFLKWIIVCRQRIVRPFWFINYSKKEAREILEKRLQWEYYGGHHLENRATAFFHKIYTPQRFGMDYRNLGLAAEVRSGFLSREKALEIYRTPLAPDTGLVEYVKKRLGLSDETYMELMKAPLKSFRDYRTYKKRFERCRPLFYLFAKAQLVPMSFYIKYCFPIEDPR